MTTQTVESSNVVKLLSTYGEVMLLKIYVANNNKDLYKKYLSASIAHNKKVLENIDYIDAGFDLYSPAEEYIDKEHDEIALYKLDHQICCSAQIHTGNYTYNTGYYMYPRSSLSKTPLRLANSVGIIDAGYRGHLIAMFDLPISSHRIKQFDRYVQICAPKLMPIIVNVVDTFEQLGEQTDRGTGGFGSTGC